MYVLNNFLNIIKTGYNSKKKIIKIKITIFIYKLVLILYKEGLIYNFYIKNHYLYIILKYFENENIIKNCKLISKPGRKKYMTYSSIEKKYKNSFLIIISTSKGLLTHKDAIFNKIGGIILLEINV